MNEYYYDIHNSQLTFLEMYRLFRRNTSLISNNKYEEKAHSLHISFGLEYHREYEKFKTITAFSDIGKWEESYMRQEYERLITFFSDSKVIENIWLTDLLTFFKSFNCYTIYINPCVACKNWKTSVQMNKLLELYYSIDQDEDMPSINFFSLTADSIISSRDYLEFPEDPPVASTVKIEILRFLYIFKDPYSDSIVYPKRMTNLSKKDIIRDFSNIENDILTRLPIGLSF